MMPVRQLRALARRRVFLSRKLSSSGPSPTVIHKISLSLKVFSCSRSLSSDQQVVLVRVSTFMTMPNLMHSPTVHFNFNSLDVNDSWSLKAGILSIFS